MEKRKKLIVNITPELDQKLAEASKKVLRTKSSLVRFLISRYVKDKATKENATEGKYEAISS